MRERFPGATATGHHDISVAEDSSNEALVHGDGFDLVRSAWSEIGNYRSLARAHLALSNGAPKAAVEELQALREDALSAHRHYFALRVDTLLSAALLDAGEPIKAVETLHNVVKRAAPAGSCRRILDSGPQIGLMLAPLRRDVERK